MIPGYRTENEFLDHLIVLFESHGNKKGAHKVSFLINLLQINKYYFISEGERESTPPGCMIGWPSKALFLWSYGKPFEADDSS